MNATGIDVCDVCGDRCVPVAAPHRHPGRMPRPLDALPADVRDWCVRWACGEPMSAQTEAAPAPPRAALRPESDRAMLAAGDGAPIDDAAMYVIDVPFAARTFVPVNVAPDGEPPRWRWSVL